MKNDIDSLLNSMFRNGKLDLSSAKRREEQAAGAFRQTQKAAGAVSSSLQGSIEQLTREAQADMEALNARLQEDGLKKQGPAGNSGSSGQISAAFETARKEAAEQVLGQDEFLAALIIAYKRPFVAGFDSSRPMSRTMIAGKPGTGKHSAIASITGALARLGVLKSPKTAVLDLSRYKEASDEKLFVQDLYAALKSGASVLLFEHYENCGTAVLSLLPQLFLTGTIPLPGRYAEQKGLLIEIGGALAPGAISSLSAAGKYLFLLTERSPEQAADTFGAPFLAALDDICETGEFTEESLRAIAGRTLKSLCRKAEKQLSFILSYGEAEIAFLSSQYRADKGAAVFEEQANALYRALSDVKLRRNLKTARGKIIVENGVLTAVSEDANTGFSAAPAIRRETEASVEAVKHELSEIVGLNAIKEYILSLEANFKMQQLRREKGLKADSPSMHMIFTGNPGTGKTTVARLISRYLKAIGALTGGQLTEVSRADLVGKYVGHTAPLTQKAIQSSLGGVLFIDEAYSLYRGRDDSFGLECIDTLVKGMEDYREDLVVILAGYTREMEEFLTANSGLRSRFPHVIEFPDYTAAELLEIAKNIAKNKGYQIEPACNLPLLAYFERQQQEGNPRTNGNGRMARNKVEEAIVACSRRNLELPAEEQNLELLLPGDFGLPV